MKEQITFNKYVENKKQVSEIEINDVKLEITKEDFEYPENIQKETGILGYERYILSNEQILNSLVKILTEDELNLIKEKTQIDLKSTNDINVFQQYLSTSYLFGQNNELKEVLNKIELFSKKLLLSLTEDKFPSETLTYIMSNHKDKHRLERKQFIEDKFLLQDVYGVDTYNSIEDKQGKIHPFDRVAPFAEGVDHPDASKFITIDKNTNKKIGRDSSFGEVANEQGKGLENNKVSIISGNGLNVCDNNFFYDYNIFDNQPAFGFSYKEDFFQGYMDKTIARLREVNRENLNTSDENDLFLKTIFNERLFTELFAIKESAKSNDIFRKPDNNKRGGENYFSSIGYDPKVFLENSTKKDTVISKLFEKYGSPLSNKDEYVFKERNNKGLDKDEAEEQYYIDSEKLSGIHGQKSLSYHLPVFINDGKVGQLKWGHANFSAFFTKNGFNVLKIKHAESFPTKEK